MPQFYLPKAYKAAKDLKVIDTDKYLKPIEAIVTKGDSLYLLTYGGELSRGAYFPKGDSTARCEVDPISDQLNQMYFSPSEVIYYTNTKLTFIRNHKEIVLLLPETGRTDSIVFEGGIYGNYIQQIFNLRDEKESK